MLQQTCASLVQGKARDVTAAHDGRAPRPCSTAAARPCARGRASHRSLTGRPVLASPTSAWWPARSAPPRAPGHAPARAAPSAHNRGVRSGGARSTWTHYGPRANDMWGLAPEQYL